MKILQNTNDLNIVINTEQNFQTDLGWQDNLAQFEDEVLKDIINPADNYETVRYIHEPYNKTISGVTLRQTDIWFQFYFKSGSTYIQDYEAVGINKRENELMLKQSTESFFRLEFFKTPKISGSTYDAPTRQNRRLVFAKNLSLPLGEKFFYTGQNFGYNIHVPVFMGSNYKNKENMYLFWFEDETVLEDSDLIGTENSNTFFMTAKFFNAKDGDILDFTNRALSTGATIDEKNDMYYQVDFNLTGRTYQIYKYTGGTRGDRVGFSDNGLTKTIQFFEKGGGVLSTQPIFNPTPTPTIILTPVPTHTPYPSITPTPTPTPIPETSESSYYLSLERCSNGAIVWSDAVEGAPGDPDFNYEIGTFVYDQNNVYYEVIDFEYFSSNPDPSTSIIIQGTAVGCPTPTPTPTPTLTPTPTPTGLPATPTPSPTPTPIVYTFSLGYNASDSYDACLDYSSSPTNYYSYNSTFINGTILYTTTGNPLTGNAPTGYYSNGTGVGLVSGGSGVVNDITPCGTNPPTPTPTPIYQGVAIYTGLTFNSSTNACADGSPPTSTVYVSISELPLGNGDRLYTNTNLTTNFVGNDQYYRIFINPSFYVATISAAGYISNFTACGSVPTPTPVPPTPTPTVLSYEFYIGPDYATALNACNNFDMDLQNPVYAAASTPNAVTQFFTDLGLTTTFTGSNDKYCWAPSSNLSNKWVGNVSGTGNTSSVNVCP